MTILFVPKDALCFSTPAANRRLVVW